MKTTTNTILPNDCAVRINKTKTAVSYFKKYDTIGELKIKAAIKTLEAVVKNLEEEVSKLRKQQSC